MNQLNSVLLEGRIVGDPVTDRTETTAATVLEFEIESLYVRDAEYQVVSRFDVVAYGKNAALHAPVLRAGMLARVVGRLGSQNYIASDGLEHKDVLVIAEWIEERL